MTLESQFGIFLIYDSIGLFSWELTKWTYIYLIVIYFKELIFWMYEYVLILEITEMDFQKFWN